MHLQALAVQWQAQCTKVVHVVFFRAVLLYFLFFWFLQLLRAVARPYSIFFNNIVSVDPHSAPWGVAVLRRHRHIIFSALGIGRHYIWQVGNKTSSQRHHKLHKSGSCVCQSLRYICLATVCIYMVFRAACIQFICYAELSWYWWFSSVFAGWRSCRSVCWCGCWVGRGLGPRLPSK